MSVIGTLTVDLVANTAQFTGDLEKVGGKLKVLGDDAEGAGEKIDFSMREARGSLMLMGDEFGIHLPREIRTMIAEIPGIGIALESLLPILGAVFAAKMIFEWVEANKKAAEELKKAWETQAASTTDVFDRLGNKLLEVGIKADQLAGNHFEALHKQLELVDRQTLTGIIGEIDKMGKEADNVFDKMQSNWFMQLLMGRGDTGPAKAELAGMVEEINKLKNSGVDPGNATRALLGTDIDKVSGKIEEIQAKLKRIQDDDSAARAAGSALGVDIDARRIRAAEEELSLEKQNLETLQQMQSVAALSAKIGEGEKKNDTTEAEKKEYEEQLKIYEAQQRGLEQRRKAEAEFAKKVTEEKKKAAKEDEQIAEEEMRATTAVMDQQAKLQDSLAKEALKQQLTMAKLREDAEDESLKHRLVMREVTEKRATEEEIANVQERAKAEQQALDQQIAALDKHDANYLVQLQQFENKKQQAIKQAENQVTKIRDQAAEKQFQDVARAQARMDTVLASTVAKSLVEGKNMAQGFENMGKQMLEAATENTLKMLMLDDMKQAKDAGHAAASAFKWVMQDVPFPANAVIAPIAAGAAFAGVMAFEQGGLVPGTGPLPATVHGGETVVTKALTDRVKDSEGRGGRQRQPSVVVNVTAKDADSFKRSESQVAAKIAHGQMKAQRRNH